MDAETWLNAKDAAELGFADSVPYVDVQRPVMDTAGADFLMMRQRSKRINTKE